MMFRTMSMKPTSRAFTILAVCLYAGVAFADYEVSSIGGVIKAGDRATDLTCPNGSSIVGFRFRAGIYVDRIQLKCAPRTGRMTLGNATDGPTTSGPINPAEVLIPGVSSREKTVFCPKNYIVSGIKAQGGKYVDRINSIRCTRYGGSTVRFRDVGIGGTGGATTRAYCSSRSGDVVKNFRAKSGFWVDALKTFCRAQ